MTGKGCSSPGNANLRIGTQADHDEESHSDLQRKYALQHSSPAILAHVAVTSTSGVIPAKAGILTRVALDEGRAVVVNCAGIPSKHISYAKRVELCALKSLMWIRAMGDSKRP